MSKSPVPTDENLRLKLKRSPLKRLIIFLCAWCCMVLAVIGIILPIMPGVIFFIIGFYLFSLESAWVNRQLDKFVRKYPKMGEMLNDGRSRANRLLRRILGE